MLEEQRRSRAGTRGWVLLTGLQLLAAALYLSTLAPGLLWGDSARFVDRSIGYVPGAEPGEHHLRNWFGLLANQLPWGSIPWRQNLVSAVFGTLAVGALARVVLLLTRSGWAAAIAAVAFAVSHTQWHLSAICESYTLLAFLWIVATEMLLRWQATGDGRWVLAASFVCGLAAADHLVTFVLGPAVVLFLLVGRPWPGGAAAMRALAWIPLLAIAFVAGFMPALAGGIRVHCETGRAWGGVLYDFLDLRGKKYIDLGRTLRMSGSLVAFLGYQFPLAAGILGLVGLFSSLRGGVRRAALPILLFVWLFVWSALYIQQRNAYLMIVGYAMFAIWIGCGVDAARRALGGRAAPTMIALLVMCAATPPLLYACAPAIVRHFRIPLMGADRLREIGPRGPEYFLQPWKNGEDSAEKYAREALSVVPRRGVIVEDFTPGAVLSYVQRWEGVRPDVSLHALPENEDLVPWLERTLPAREVFLASDAPAYQVDRLRNRYQLTWIGPLLRVRRR